MDKRPENESFIDLVRRIQKGADKLRSPVTYKYKSGQYVLFMSPNAEQYKKQYGDTIKGKITWCYRWNGHILYEIKVWGGSADGGILNVKEQDILRQCTV